MTNKYIKGVVAASLSAQAADMPLKAKPPESFNWGGCYLGGSLGYAWGRDFDTETVATTGLLSGSNPPMRTGSSSAAISAATGRWGPPG
jgi:opacity protein-like surface antigen